MAKRTREWPAEIAGQLPGPADHSDRFLEPETGATWYVNAYHAAPWTQPDLRRLLHIPPSRELVRLDLVEPRQYPDYAFQIFGLAISGEDLRHCLVLPTMLLPRRVRTPSGHRKAACLVWLTAC